MSSTASIREELKQRSSVDSSIYQESMGKLNQTFGGPKPEQASITTLDTLREERSKFDAFLQQLDEKVELGFANELEDDFEKSKCYKLPHN
jgi:hypothetical protein